MPRPNPERYMAAVRGVGLVLVLALAGCGSEAQDASTVDSSPAPVATVSPDNESVDAEPTVDAGGDEAVDGYIEGVASANPDVARDALQYAAEDSVAHVYLQHRVNFFEAALDGGVQYGDQSVETIDDGYELCDQLDVAECGEFTGLEVVDGKVADLLVDGQSPGSRLAVGDGSVVDSRGVTAQFLTAYRSIQSESLFVTIEVATGTTEAELFLYSATTGHPTAGNVRPLTRWGRMRLAQTPPPPSRLCFPVLSLAARSWSKDTRATSSTGALS